MRRRDLLISGTAAAVLTMDAASAQPAAGGADLNVSPKRVVFSSDMRSAAIYIFNRGADQATYSVSLTDRVMTPDGQVRAISDPEVAAQAAAFIAKLPSAQPMLTFTPRRVTLRPGQSQVVRLRALRPPEMTLPEYHTHLTVTTTPGADTGETVEEAASGAARGVVAKINTLFSISIAVIVRQGPVDVQGALDRASVSLRTAADGRRTAFISVDVLRKGANSLFGDLEVREAKAPKSAAPLGVLMGVGVYTEVERRAVEIPLTRIPPQGAPLEIVFKDDDTKPAAVLARATCIAP